MQTQQPVSTILYNDAITSSAPAAAIEQDLFNETLQYRISGDSRVRLVFDGAVTREAIKKLRQYLELAEEDYPSKDELEQQAVEQSTVTDSPEPE